MMILYDHLYIFLGVMPTQCMRRVEILVHVNTFDLRHILTRQNVHITYSESSETQEHESMFRILKILTHLEISNGKVG